MYLDLKNEVKALEDFDEAIRLRDDYPECYYFRGLTKVRLKQYLDSIIDFEKALTLNSTNMGGIYNGMGLAYKELGDFKKALHVRSRSDLSS